ncbi:FecR family protein [Chitinophaga skermanii]|uniref:FecR family protein n=1 Tax=Chitinophaga skermanii TaxID=331697 RepID=A0A327QY65_9BACT|nr:FecR domain-containing protein [Chitinophaga skermanii]RAJ06617.1 FecR family protein [Chitinophaga skermanii]
MNANILFKHINGECDAAEKEMVTAWLDASARNREIYATLRARKQALEFSPVSDWERMQRMMQTEEEMAAPAEEWLAETPRRTKFWRAAAVAASLVGLTTSGMFFWNRQQATAYTPSFVTINTDQSTKKKLTLPDGSTVWLLYNSTLRYDSLALSKNERKMFLEGEAFFDVVQAPSAPFSVHIQDMDVNVLGTSFKVKSRPGMTQEVAVASGKISVSTPALKVQLSPTQRIQYANGRSSIDTLSIDAITAVRENKLVFENASIATIAKHIAEWYNMKVVIKSSSSRPLSFTGSIADDGVYKVLDGLSFLAGFDYKVKDSTIFILPKP